MMVKLDKTPGFTFVYSEGGIPARCQVALDSVETRGTIY